MKLYMFWMTGGIVLVGRVDEGQICTTVNEAFGRQLDQPTKPTRVHKPMLMMEQVKAGKVKHEVNVAFGPMTSSVYVPWVDVHWDMCAPLEATAHHQKLAAAYEKISDEIHIKATTGLEVVGKLDRDAATAAYEAAQKMKAEVHNDR